MIYIPLRLCMCRKMIIKSDAQMFKPTQNWKTNLCAEEKEYRLILKGTKPGARSYQCKCAVSQAFKNKSIESMEEVGAAIKKIIHFKTICGKFSSVHPNLAAEGITRVEVGDKGFHFIKHKETG